MPRMPRRPVTAWLISAIVWPQDQGSDCLPVLGTDEAAAQILVLSFGPCSLGEESSATIKLFCASVLPTMGPENALSAILFAVVR